MAGGRLTGYLATVMLFKKRPLPEEEIQSLRAARKEALAHEFAHALCLTALSGEVATVTLRYVGREGAPFAGTTEPLRMCAAHGIPAVAVAGVLAELAAKYGIDFLPTLLARENGVEIVIERLALRSNLLGEPPNLYYAGDLGTIQTHARELATPISEIVSNGCQIAIPILSTGWVELIEVVTRSEGQLPEDPRDTHTTFTREDLLPLTAEPQGHD